jgi:hypothetical protein
MMDHVPSHEDFFWLLTKKFNLFGDSLRASNAQQQEEIFRIPFASLTILDYSLELPSVLDSFLPWFFTHLNEFTTPQMIALLSVLSRLMTIAQTQMIVLQ